ncbi:MAG TPA: diacylglycerol kinase family protein [Microbacteriaceae bacterium]|nr:diacylglycerol kinase family protein [Microbacteriaceae bacterium]
MRIIVAVNPNSSFGRHRGAGERVANALRAAGHDVEALQKTSFIELSDAVAEGVASRPDLLVVVGGDGMVSLGVNALAGTEIPLGIVAAGTGNDMARGLGLAYRTPDESLDGLLALLRSEPRRIDLGRIRTADGTERWFGCVLSAGFDAIVNERANRMRRPRGASRYIIALLLELVGLRSRRYRLVVDDVETRMDAVLIAVGNNSSLGGGMHITPNASLDDGKLDVVVGKAMGRFELIRLFPKVFSGAHIGHPKVVEQLGSHIVIDTPGVIAYADGERVGPLPGEITVHPGALRVLAPR